MNRSTPSGPQPVNRARFSILEMASRASTLLSAVGLGAFVVLAHFASASVFRSEVMAESGWQTFRAQYQIDYFGTDGQFVRAIQNGYNLVFHTHKYAPRFTRRGPADQVNSCSGCHTVEDLAYAFVNSDRYDPKVQKRVSFEERVQRCYIGSLDGFAPTIYDPAVRDIRLLARAVAHELHLTEGAMRKAR